MTNAIAAKDSTVGSVDAFGMTGKSLDDGSALPDDEALLADAAASPIAPAGKSAGLPRGAMIGLGAFGLLMAIVLIMLFVNVLGKKSNAQLPTRQLSEQAATAPIESSSLIPLRSDLAQLKSSVASIDATVAQLRFQVEGLARAQDGGNISGRLAATEAALSSTKSTLAALEKRSISDRSMDIDLTVRDDARVVSIGAGSARLATEGGKETVVRKGDMWSGLVVREVRSDRGFVVLSDGTILR